MLARYWRVLEPFHRTIYWYMAISVLYQGLSVAEGYMMSTIIQLFQAQVQWSAWMLFFAGKLVYDELFMRLDNYLDYYIATRIIHPIKRHLKLSSVEKFLEMDLAWHQRHNSGALVSKVVSGIDKVDELLMGLSWDFIPTMIQLLLSLIPLLIFSPPTALIASLACVLFFWLSYKGTLKRQPYQEKIYDLKEEDNHRMVESTQGIETVKVFGQGDRLIAMARDLQDQIIHLGKVEAWIAIYGFNRPRIRILTTARSLTWGFWVYQLYAGQMDVPTLIFLNVLVEKLLNSFWRFSRLFDQAAESSEGARRLAETLEQRPQMQYGTLQPVIDGPIKIEVKNLCFTYEDVYDQEDGGLHRVSFTVNPGEIVAIVGPSGAGKTTLRKVISGLVEPHSGAVLINGIDTRMWSREALFAVISAVMQLDQIVIFEMDIAGNIAFSRPRATQAEIERVAKQAQIHDFIRTLPLGYRTKVGERGHKLSGGQKQRIALARAILADRFGLFFDEATSALDALTEHAIDLNQLCAGSTTILVAHRLSTIWDIADRIIVLDRGRVVEEGTHVELMALGGLYAAMVAEQTHQGTSSH